jgi:hypothetical protein
MKCQDRITKRNAVAVLERRARNRPVVDQRLIARPGRQVHEDELLVRGPPDERMVAVDGVVLERNLIVAVPPDA